jgi:hypothetical protein
MIIENATYIIDKKLTVLTALIHKESPPRLRPVTGYLICLPLILIFTYVGAAGHDDSHITFWQAWTLNHHHALLNYNGDRIEQGSSLLHTLLTALTARLTGLDEATSGYSVALAAALMTLLYLLYIARQLVSVPLWLPALMTSSSAYFSYWACSGMETSLAAGCSVLFIHRHQQCLKNSLTSHTVWLHALIPGLLLATVRPEMLMVGPLWLCVMAALQPAARAALLPWLLPFLLVFLWRYSYFNQWFPNPVYAKTSITSLGQALEQLHAGMQYALRLGRDPALASLTLVFTACLIRASSFIWKQRARPSQETSSSSLVTTLPWLAWIALYAVFVIVSGGDWMKEGRFWVPLIPSAALVICAVCWSLPVAARYLLAGSIVLLQLTYAFTFIEKQSLGMQWSDQERWTKVFPYTRFFERSNREHLRDLPLIAELEYWIPRLYAHKQEPITIMSKQMGMVNYSIGRNYFRQFRVMDMAGLVENSLRTCTPLAQDGFERQGMRLNYRKFFDRLPQARQHCGIEAPDVIHDIYGWGESTPLPDYLKTQGYSIVFHQTGRISMKPGADITAHEVLAIRTELISFSRRKSVQLDFNTLLPP